MFNISATEDMDMVAQIKKEVRKLCTRNIIASQIQLNEEDQDRKENLTRMIYESEKEMKVLILSLIQIQISTFLNSNQQFQQHCIYTYSNLYLVVQN